MYPAGKLLSKNSHLLVALVCCSGLPQSGKKVWKMKNFPGQGKVREFWFESGKLEKLTKVREKSGNFKISENLDGYGSLFNFQKHKFTELVSFFC